MFNLVSTSGKQAYGVKEFALDKETDLSKIDVNDCALGSVAFIIENSTYYMLNGEKKWIKVNLATGGSSGGGGGDTPPSSDEIIYEGGDLDG